mgnify:CR=1 FL=1|tara:strand:- start:371 stop:526 length:156 start_codon:yes stop_codon:yes gene_type:complete
MIEIALQLLTIGRYYGASERIEIAKGKYELADTVKKGINKVKRNYKWQQKK